MYVEQTYRMFDCETCWQFIPDPPFQVNAINAAQVIYTDHSLIRVHVCSLYPLEQHKIHNSLLFPFDEICNSVRDKATVPRTSTSTYTRSITGFRLKHGL
jgi:hypothetical protein